MSATAELLIVVDLGNTNLVVGIYRGDELVEHIRLATDTDRTAQEYAALLAPLLARKGLHPEKAAGVVVSSVVPPLTPVVERLCRDLFGREPLLLEPGVKTGMPILSDHPSEVGGDRIANAVAALELHGAPAVVVDFGTALTFDVVSPEGAYVGGLIAPGPDIAAEALFSRASRLYRVDFKPPPRLIGASTVTAMQSGLFHGYLGLVDGILGRLVDEIDGLETIVATGGRAALFAGASRFIQAIDPHLTLKGLKLIYRRNRG